MVYWEKLNGWRKVPLLFYFPDAQRTTSDKDNKNEKNDLLYEIAKV